MLQLAPAAAPLLMALYMLTPTPLDSELSVPLTSSPSVSLAPLSTPLSPAARALFRARSSLADLRGGSEQVKSSTSESALLLAVLSPASETSSSLRRSDLWASRGKLPPRGGRGLRRWL